MIEVSCSIRVVDVRLPPAFTDQGCRPRSRPARVPGPPVLSRYVEPLSARDLPADRAGGGLVKDRVARVAQPVDVPGRPAGSGGHGQVVRSV
jgi:hypothetical protein